MNRLLIQCSTKSLSWKFIRDSDLKLERGLQESGFGSFTGFYDWLRTGPNYVVGLRFWPFEDSARVLTQVSLPIGSVRNLDKSYLFFWKTPVSFDEQISGDQEIEEARLLIHTGQHDGFSLVFGCSSLSKEEIESIKAESRV